MDKLLPASGVIPEANRNVIRSVRETCRTHCVTQYVCHPMAWYEMYDRCCCVFVFSVTETRNCNIRRGVLLGRRAHLALSALGEQGYPEDVRRVHWRQGVIGQLFLPALGPPTTLRRSGSSSIRPLSPTASSWVRSCSAQINSVLMKVLPEFFYRTHDPTTVNRQGPKNVGSRT